MSTVFFDTKHVRRTEMLRRDKNHSSVLPLNPRTFLVKRNPTALPGAPSGKNKFNSVEGLVSKDSQPTAYVVSKHLSWWMMKT
jgi:hypothetical protein